VVLRVRARRSAGLGDTSGASAMVESRRLLQWDEWRVLDGGVLLVWIRLK